MELPRGIDHIISAIEDGLAHSVEVNKHNALINLMHRAGVSIPLQAKHLVHNLSDTIAPREYAFTRGLVYRLAMYYLALSKHYFQKELAASCPISWQVQHAIDDAFRGSTFAKLKLLCPHSQILKRIENEVYASFVVVGKSLTTLSNDFALEILLINGLSPPPLKQEVRAYRGLKINANASDIDSWFKYGITGRSDRIFNFHVRETWNTSDGWWEFGGTYVTLDAYVAARFACGVAVENQEYSPLEREILIEVRLPANTPKICGSSAHEYELVPNRIDAENVIAVYKLACTPTTYRRVQVQVIEAFYNPYVADAKANYQIGDSVAFNTERVEVYKSLDCNANQISALFIDYADFIGGYTQEKHMQARATLDSNYFADRPIFDSIVYPAGCDPEIASC